MIVKESINFKRGIDARSGLGIGLGRWPGVLEFDKLAKESGFTEAPEREGVKRNSSHTFLAGYKTLKGNYIDILLRPLWNGRGKEIIMYQLSPINSIKSFDEKTPREIIHEILMNEKAYGSKS
jgi:hypothetical protein